MVNDADGRRVRSAETRQRLLSVGGRVFAERGFDGATTRVLAESAGVNVAAILYHFGGKEGLYVAIAEAIASRARAALGPYLPADEPAPRVLEAAEARVALGTLLRGMVRALLSVAGDASIAAFVVGEHTRPGPAFERLYAGYMRPLHARATTLVAVATGRAADDEAAILDAHAIIGMALAFAVAREAALRRTGWRAYDPKRIELIAEHVATLAQRAVAPHTPASSTTRRRSKPMRTNA